MSDSQRPDVFRSLRLYGLGHLILFAGAAAMHWSGSMLPMAGAASASLLLTVPLVRDLASRSAARARARAIAPPRRRT